MRLSLFFGIALAIISVLCIWIKLYTIEVMLDDAATIMVIVKDKPSLENRRIMMWEPSLNSATKLIYDENGYIGMSLYAAIVSWVWIVLPLLTIIFFMGRKIWYLSHKLAR